MQNWLAAFSEAAASGNGDQVAQLFEPQGLWRDYLPFGGTLKTVEGRSEICDFATAHGRDAGFKNATCEGDPGAQEGFFRFSASKGKGRGYLRLRGGQCHTLFTMLQTPAEIPDTASTPDPYVLIIGGGQGGLALGAQLQDLNIPYLIVDKYPQIGDQWRSRYETLVLHDPVWYDHMPFLPFPDDWPVFTPKDQMGDWLQAYAEKLSLNVQTSTQVTGARFDETTSRWDVSLRQGTHMSTHRPRQLVFALGISGFPNTPDFDGQDRFEGAQMHSSAYKGGATFANQSVVVIGANNSAHDIASDLVRHGAKPTMIQRSSTLVVRQSDYCEKLLGPLYSKEALAAGLTTETADILQAASPIRLLETSHKPIWDKIQADQEAYYDRLRQAGFTLDFAEDGTGLGMKYRRTASGYYIDVGAADMVADGRISIRSGTTVDRLNRKSVVLDTGEEISADTIVYATGFGTMTDWVEALIDKQTAEKVGPCWGYGSGTKGDPGPWLGELRNMWMPTAQDGLWFMGGNLSQARFYSRLLALQLLERFEA